MDKECRKRVAGGRTRYVEFLPADRPPGQAGVRHAGLYILLPSLFRRDWVSLTTLAVSWPSAQLCYATQRPVGPWI